MNSRYLPTLIMAGLFVWGVFLAIGAYRFNHDLRRAVFVLACTLGFILAWMFLLRLRARKAR